MSSIVKFYGGIQFDRHMLHGRCGESESSDVGIRCRIYSIVDSVDAWRMSISDSCG
jgi:hypothetical protein